MIAEQWEHIKEVFETALHCSLEERQSLLMRLAEEDPGVADQVVRLLASYDKAGDFLVEPCCPSPDFLEDLSAEQQRFFPDDVVCGRFRIVSLLGRGGMGEVYKAWDEELEDHVALKTLRPEISTHELFTSRFRREIQLARKVTHPNVCRIFDSFKHAAGDGTYISVLSMELLQGQTLADYVKAKGRLSGAEAMPLVQQIVAGLSAIHAAGIIHRDLKPANLVLVAVPAAATDAAFQIKITDFGIAGRLPDSLSPGIQTEASKLLGTPDYMAPEQLEGTSAGVQSDIYSLGLILYEMVTGVKPFAGGSAWQRISADAPSPRRRMRDLPENWSQAIVCCLERNPAYRFQNAQAVLESLATPVAAAKIPAKPFIIRVQRAAKAKAGLIAGFVLLAVALSWVLFRMHRLNLQNSKAPEGSMLLLTKISNDSHDPELNGVTDVLRGQLSQSAYLSLLDDASIHETLKRMARSNEANPDADTAREIAMRNGAPLVVFGVVSQNTSVYTLELDLERVGSEPERPARSWRFRETAPNKRQLFEVIDQGSGWIRRTIGETETEVERRDRKPEDVTTDSWEALDLYSQGQKLASEGQVDKAVLLFKEATDKDPQFAMAWMRAGDILDTGNQLDEGLRCWRKALAVSGVRRLSRREELRIKAMYASDTGNVRSAVDFFGQYSLAYPNDYFGYFFRAYPLMLMGRPEEAVELLKEAEKRQPGSYYIADHLARYNLLVGNFTEFSHYTARLRELGHPDYADEIEGQAAHLRGDDAEAMRLFAGLRASSDPYLRSVSYSLEAALLADTGRYAQAIDHLKEGSTVDLASGVTGARADKLLGLSYLYLKSGNLEASRDAALKAVDAEPGIRRRSDAGALLARGGWIADARRLLRMLSADHLTVLSEVARLRLQGEILMAEGKLQESLQVLRHAFDLNQERATLDDALVRALVKSHRQRDAIQVLEQLRWSRAQVWHQAETYAPGLAADLLLEYGTAAIALGKTEGKSALAEYFHLRRDSDPELPDIHSARLLQQRIAQSQN